MSIKLQNKQENMDVKADVLQMLKKNKKWKNNKINDTYLLSYV